MKNKRYCISESYSEQTWHFSTFDLLIKIWIFIYNDEETEILTTKTRIYK